MTISVSLSEKVNFTVDRQGPESLIMKKTTFPTDSAQGAAQTELASGTHTACSMHAWHGHLLHVDLAALQISACLSTSDRFDKHETTSYLA